MRGRIACWCAAACCAAAVGCGVRLAPVEGRVTLDGVPVEGAAVSFYPVSGQGRPAVATTDAAGRFRLETDGKTGALTGRFKVFVSKSVFAPPPGPGDEPPADEDEEAGRARRGRASGLASKVKDFLPPVYADPEKTPLSADVPAAGAAELHFDLVSQKE